MAPRMFAPPSWRYPIALGLVVARLGRGSDGVARRIPEALALARDLAAGSFADVGDLVVVEVARVGGR